jgi:hypothetical protein
MATYTKTWLSPQFETGLATVGYTLYNADMSLNTARATAGVTEAGTTGIYGKSLTLTTTWEGFIYWDDGQTVPDTGVEDILPVLDVTTFPAGPYVALNLTTVSVGAAARINITLYQHAAIDVDIPVIPTQTGKSHTLLVYSYAAPSTVLWSLTTAAGEISLSGDGLTVTLTDTDAHTGTAGTWGYVLRNTTDDLVVTAGSIEILKVPDVPVVP